MNNVRWFAWIAFASLSLAILEGGSSSPTTTAQVVVTVGHHYGAQAPSVKLEDLTVVSQRGETLPVTTLSPLRGERAGLELFLLVDNCSNCEVGSKFDELQRFIKTQPPSTAIGVAYIQDGKLHVAENPTGDHERALKALNAPTGSKPSDPFNALTELIKSWPHNSLRHVVLMISNGIDVTAADQMADPSAEGAIEAAERANVIVYAIYHPSADYLKSTFAATHFGQVQLAHVADESGGEAYFLGTDPLPSLAPFLADMSDHLANQYLVQFAIEPAESGGALQPVSVRAKEADLELMVPYKVWIPGAARGTDRKASQGKRP